jgi:hypothetical protein
MDRRLSSLNKMDELTTRSPSKEKAEIIGSAYDDLFASVRPDKGLGKISDHDLDVLYNAAHVAAFYTIAERYIQDMTAVLNELEKRGLAARNHYLHMYEAFIKARMLAQARELAKRHPLPDLEVLPELGDAPDLVAGWPTELVVDPVAPRLLRRSVDLHEPAQVVVVSHPLCHFSQAAMQEIQADPVLRKIFDAHAKWLAPQDPRFDVDVLRRWNREHPGQEINLTFRREEWPMLDVWSTPTFYFFKNGAVTAKVEGWPKGGHRSELLAALRQVGLW